MSIDQEFAVLASGIDDRLSGHDRAVMTLIGKHGLPTSLDQLCEWLPQTPRPYVFYAVARLEDLGYLEKGVIR